MLNSCATGRKQADAPSQVKSFKDQQKRKEGRKRHYGIDKLITKDMEDFQKKWPT
jgi:hypothetical protein